MKEERHQIFMEEALKLAKEAKKEEEVPVGAVIVYKNRIISRGYNQVEKLKDPTAHAEMIAITSATSFLKSKWLKECTLYVTIEPCIMCAFALVLARIDKIVFGAPDKRGGGFGSKIDVNKLMLNHYINVEKYVLEEQCAQIIKEFFREKRGKDKQTTDHYSLKKEANN